MSYSGIGRGKNCVATMLPCSYNSESLAVIEDKIVHANSTSLWRQWTSGDNRSTLIGSVVSSMWNFHCIGPSIYKLQCPSVLAACLGN